MNDMRFSILVLVAMFLTIPLYGPVLAEDVSGKSWSEATAFRGWNLSIKPMGHGSEVALVNKCIKKKCAPLVVDYLIEINRLLQDGELANAGPPALRMADSLCEDTSDQATKKIELLFTESAEISQKDLWDRFVDRFAEKFAPICGVNHECLASYWDSYKDGYYFIPLANRSHVMLYKHGKGTYTIFIISPDNESLRIGKWIDRLQHFRQLGQEFWMAEFNPSSYSNRINHELFTLANLATDFYKEHGKYPNAKEMAEMNTLELTDPWGEYYFYSPCLKGECASVLTTCGNEELDLKNVGEMHIFVGSKKEWCYVLLKGKIFKLDDTGSLQEVSE